jgi:hypothetical protein
VQKGRVIPYLWKEANKGRWRLWGVAAPAIGWPRTSIEVGKRERSQRRSRWRAQQRWRMKGRPESWPAAELREVGSGSTRWRHFGAPPATGIGSSAPTRRGGRDGGNAWLWQTTEAAKHAVAASSACGFRRSGCRGKAWAERCKSMHGGGLGGDLSFIGRRREPWRTRHTHQDGGGLAGRGGLGLWPKVGSGGPSAGWRRATAGWWTGSAGLQTRLGRKDDTRAKESEEH